MAVDLGRVGLWVRSTTWPTDPGALRDAAAEAERLGFGAVWLGGSAGDLVLPEAILDATDQLVVATGIVNVWTEPAGLASASYARVARRHADRFLLGLGAGHAENVEPVTGERYVQPLRKVRGYLDDLDAAQPPVPVDRRVLAALGPKVLALAGERAAGAHPYLVTPEHTRQAREILGPGPLLAPEQKVLLETDPQRARTAARAAVGFYLALPNYANNLLRLGFTADDLAGGGSDRLIDGLVAWGDVDTVLAKVAEHHAAGADHVCLQAINPTYTDGGFPLPEWRELAAGLPGR